MIKTIITSYSSLARQQYADEYFRPRDGRRTVMMLSEGVVTKRQAHTRTCTSSTHKSGASTDASVVSGECLTQKLYWTPISNHRGIIIFFSFIPMDIFDTFRCLLELL